MAPAQLDEDFEDSLSREVLGGKLIEENGIRSLSADVLLVIANFGFSQFLPHLNNS